MEDLEKGLMLAGLITPLNSQEFAEREAVSEMGAIDPNEKSKTFFKRSVLAAEIASELHSEITFGRVKFQKMIYLCECVGGMQVQNRYKKFAAGPFDNKFMHSIVPEFEKQKWFRVDVKKENGYSRTVYSPLSNAGGHAKYYEKYFADQKEQIARIIDLFRKSHTKKVELVATLYYCIEELVSKNKIVNEDNLFPLFYSWAEEKSKFTNDEIKNELYWMKENGLYPIQRHDSCHE